MELRIKIKPIVVVGVTKNEVNDKIDNTYGNSYTTHGRRMSENKVVLINYEKHRMKSIQKKSLHSKTTSKVYKKGKWIAYVYLIDVELMEKFNTKQYSRNFTIEPI